MKKLEPLNTLIFIQCQNDCDKIMTQDIDGGFCYSCHMPLCDKCYWLHEKEIGEGLCENCYQLELDLREDMRIENNYYERGRHGI